MVGYDETTRSYRIWVDDRNKIVVSRDVTFHEDQCANPDNEAQLLVSDDDDDIDDIPQIATRIVSNNSLDQKSIPPQVMTNHEGAAKLETIEEEDSISLSPPASPKNSVPFTLRRSNRAAPLSLKAHENLSYQFGNEEHLFLTYCFHSGPISYAKAVTDPVWRPVLDTEMDGFKKLETFSKVKEDKKMHVLRTQFILSVKGNGTKKARLVVFGNNQKPGIEFNETWALPFSIELSVFYVLSQQSLVSN
jgi:hypothetical protein